MPLITDEVRAQATKGVREAMTSLREGRQGAFVSDGQIDRLQKLSLHLAEQLRNATEAGVVLSDLSKRRRLRLPPRRQHDGARPAHRRPPHPGARLPRLGAQGALPRHRHGLLKLGLGLLLHDVGMLSVPDSIVHKGGPLTPEEMAVMRSTRSSGRGCSAAGRESARAGGHPPPPRALGRQRLPLWPARRGHPSARARSGRRGRLLRDDEQPPARAGEASRGGVADDRRRRRNRLRSTHRGRVPRLRAAVSIGTEVVLNTGERALVAGFGDAGGLERPRIRTIEVVDGQDHPGVDIDLQAAQGRIIERSCSVAEPSHGSPAEGAVRPPLTGRRSGLTAPIRANRPARGPLFPQDRAGTTSDIGPDASRVGRLRPMSAPWTSTRSCAATMRNVAA